MKKLRLLSAIVLTLSLCLGVFAPTAFAAPYTDGVAITKIVAAPVGTTLPTGMEFEFEITPVKWDTVPYDNTNMPTFASVELALTDKATLTVPATNPYTDTGITYLVLESGDILAGIDFSALTGSTWQGAGRYEYKISEIEDTYQYSPSNVTGHIENMTWSDAEYTLYIYVEEVSGAPGTFEIVGVGVLRIAEDGGGTITGGEKVGVITPGGGNDGTDYYDYSQIIFNNSYWLTPDGDVDDPDTDDASLTISKEIDGAGLAPEDDNKFFSFDLTVTPPSVIPTADVPAYYAAFVVGTDGNIISLLTTEYAAAGDLDVIGGYGVIKFVPGVETSFNLKPGQKLMFVDTPVGTAYLVSEDATPFFQPNFTITTAGTVVTEVEGKTNQSLATETEEYTGAGKGLTNNLAAFLNICDYNPTTGLQSLPMYGLSLLAVVGLTLYVVAKSRKRKDAYSEN